MNKRDFLKSSAGTGLGIAAGASALAGAVAAETPSRSSAQAMADLNAAMPSLRLQSVLAQIELISKATATSQDRADFVRDPIRYAHLRGIELDRGFVEVMREEMRTVERKTGEAIDNARVSAQSMSSLSTSSTPTALPAIMAVAAVVSAVSAVVSAISATYMATKWQSESY